MNKQRVSLAIHSHRCAVCGNVWFHTEGCGGNQQAHTCANCGRVEWKMADIRNQGEAIHVCEGVVTGKGPDFQPIQPIDKSGFKRYVS